MGYITFRFGHDHFFGKVPDHDLIADRDEIDQSLFCLFSLRMKLQHAKEDAGSRRDELDFFSVA